MQILQTGFECFLLVMTVVWQEKFDNHRLEGMGGGAKTVFQTV